VTPDGPYRTHGADVPSPGTDLQADVARLQSALDSCMASNARIQAEGNDPAERLHQQEQRHRAAIDGWQEMERGAQCCAEAIRALEVEHD